MNVRAPKTALRDLRRSAFELIGDSRYSKPGLGGLDDKLAPYLNFKNGFFIEVGANDGFSQSNTYYLERFLGWSGVLIEGIPELHRQCARRRPRSRVHQCALVAHGSSQTSVEMHFANLMSVVDGSLKTTLAQQEQIRQELEVQSLASSYRVNVPARTLDSILDEYPQPLLIDFFSLDVEGYELQVLKGLSLEKHRPTFILVEARFFAEVDGYLQPHYELVEKLSHHDYLYRSRAA